MIRGQGYSKRDLALNTHEELADSISLKIRKATIRPRSITQQAYLTSIAKCSVTVGIGPAGTGKTYLAVASAAHALAKRPSQSNLCWSDPWLKPVSIGFLPGDIEKKVNPTCGRFMMHSTSSLVSKESDAC